MNKRLEEIRKKNAEFEKESPYNFCDRWCERCIHEKQICCALYKDELERKITCIAYGRDEEDPEITKAVMEEQYKKVDELLSEHMDKLNIDLDNPDIDENDLDEEDAIDFEDLPPDIQKHIKLVENHSLGATARNYLDKTHAFLKETFYRDEKVYPKLKYDFETVAWYHTLLPAKLHRALCGFHEPATEGDISLHDAVAQFDICLKGIEGSIRALRNIVDVLSLHKAQITILIVLLNNLDDRIKIMLAKI